MGLANILDPLDDFFLYNDVNFIKRCRAGYCNYFEPKIRNSDLMVLSLIIPHVGDLILLISSVIFALFDSIDEAMIALIIIAYLVKPVFYSLSWRNTDDIVYSLLHYISDISRLVL